MSEGNVCVTNGGEGRENHLGSSWRREEGGTIWVHHGGGKREPFGFIMEEGGGRNHMGSSWSRGSRGSIREEGGTIWVHQG